MTISRILAQMSATGQDIPQDDLHVMRLSVLDWAACALAGQGEPVSRAVRQLELENGGRPDCTVIGTSTKLPMRAAAMVNGTAAHALDFDDTHFAHIGHPSAVIVSAALAMAERRGDNDGDAFLRAAFIGAEASVRIGQWLGRPHYEAGFHQTATAGTIGAAVAGAAMFELNMQDACSAIGLATTRAAGLKVQFGTMGKPYHAGMSAASAVEAVHAAMTGVQGAQEVWMARLALVHPITASVTGPLWNRLRCNFPLSTTNSTPVATAPTQASRRRYRWRENSKFRISRRSKSPCIPVGWMSVRFRCHRRALRPSSACR